MPDDGMLQWIVMASALACAGWAVVVATAELDMLLYPHDRGAIEDQKPYRLNQRVVEKGTWRILLCLETALPAGVLPATRDSLIKAQIARSAIILPLAAMDHIVQCGLFGEVLYR
jgi:hypothetical protein